MSLLLSLLFVGLALLFADLLFVYLFQPPKHFSICDSMLYGDPIPYGFAVLEI